MIIKAVMLTHQKKFLRALRTMRNLGWIDYTETLVPRKDLPALRSLMTYGRGGFSNGDPFPHDIEPVRSNGLIGYGDLKWFQFERLRAIQRPGEIGLIIDDDLDQAQDIALDAYLEQSERRDQIALEAHGRYWKDLLPCERRVLASRHGFVNLSRRLTPKEIRGRIASLANEVRKLSEFGGGTFAYRAMPNDCLVKRRTVSRCVKWNGVLLVLYGTPNPFSRDDTTLEDYLAAGRMLCHFQLPVLADPRTAFNMVIETEKYSKGGALYEDRLAACDRLVNNYQWGGLPVFRKSITQSGGLPSVYVNRKVNSELRNNL